MFPFFKRVNYFYIFVSDILEIDVRIGRRFHANIIDSSFPELEKRRIQAFT